MATTAPTRPETPARWNQARARARDKGIRVFQVAGSGQWIATSGSRPGVAYALAVTGNICHGCECDAGEHNDPICLHRAAFYELIGAFPAIQDLLLAEDLARDAVAELSRPCWWCHGTGSYPNDWTEGRNSCEICGGTGLRPRTPQAA